MRILAILIFLSISSQVKAQEWYNNLKREHNMLRFGVGLQALEPTGINVQMFHGFFCSGNDSFATYGVWELGVGIENTIGTSTTTAYKSGQWRSGGIRAELTYLQPLITLDYGFVFQPYIGVGLQTGSRNYTSMTDGDQSSTATGGNLLLRLEVGMHGIETGGSILFVSLYVDAKYHKDFAEDFSYFKPSIGIRIRKAR
jgi:outer membrane protein W